MGRPKGSKNKKPFPKRPVNERFWEKVSYIEEGLDDCWEWQACIRNPEKGYGVFWMDGRNWPAHQVAWILTNGAIPDGLIVRHSCDNPACVNPRHLLVGTQQDNIDDKVNKGRQACGPSHAKRVRETTRRGEDHVNAKVTEALVRDIRRRHAAGASVRGLAKELGLGRSTIRHIVKRDNWRHVE